MPRRSRTEKAESRERILGSAARLFRLRGYQATSVAEVMSAAGLTVGAFYAHFPSKAALFAEILLGNASFAREQLMGPAGADLKNPAWLDRFAKAYISKKHRDLPEKGCMIPALVSEFPRLEAGARKALEDLLRHAMAAQAGAPRREAEDAYLAILCLGVGAIALSRAVASDELSGRILKAARKGAGVS